MAKGDQIETDYQHAEARFQDLLKDPQKQKTRYHWMMCIKAFQSVYMAQPKGPRADDALFMTAHVFAKLYALSSSVKDKQEALDHFTRLLRRFPESRHREEAMRAIDALSNKTAGQEGIRTIEAGALAQVKGVRFWSSPTYARVVIDVTSEVSFSHSLLKRDVVDGGHERLQIDLNRAVIGPGVTPFVPMVDALLNDALIEQHEADMVRVVLDMNSVDHFQVFSLRHPFRILVDVRGVPIKTSCKKRIKDRPEQPCVQVPKGALARQLALGVQRIVIDAGHGGRDYGASGYLKGVHEKNVTLEIAQRLADKIRQRIGCEAILTRNSDVYLSLEERTAIANAKGADLFLSIHTNAHKKMASRGTETYCLNLATDEEAILVAARENATSARNISDLEDILKELMKSAKQDESGRLAGYVQEAIIKELEAKHDGIKDKGVKQGPFYVLIGAQMPCILVEVGFITNPRECQRLNSADYQEDMADAIAVGIQRYIKDIRPLALTPVYSLIRAA
ncbi:MAG: N-acetylmuramoyl-L-alanine amidase [Deltaproteobacteria bacterium]